VYEDLTRGNPILHLLEHYCGVDRQPVPRDGAAFTRRRRKPRLAGPAAAVRRAALLAPPGQSGARRQHRPDDPDPASGRRVFYAPGLAEVDDAVFAAMAEPTA
jgi:pyrroloquinoline quinone biosynthesis protein B